MGGNALKTVKTCRLTRDNYMLVEKYVINLVLQFCQNIFVPRYSGTSGALSTCKSNDGVKISSSDRTHNFK